MLLLSSLVRDPYLGWLLYSLAPCSPKVTQKNPGSHWSGDAIEIFKTINGFNDVDPATWFTFVRDRHELNTRSFVDNGIVPEKTNLNLRRNFFTNRAAEVWNSLPTAIKSATSVNAFKNRYDDYYINAPTVPNWQLSVYILFIFMFHFTDRHAL